MSREIEESSQKSNTRHVFQIVKAVTPKIIQPRLNCIHSATGDHNPQEQGTATSTFPISMYVCNLKTSQQSPDIAV